MELPIRRFALAFSGSLAASLLALGSVNASSDEFDHGHDMEGCIHAQQRSRSTAPARFFDEATGRDLRNYPPDRLVDYHHMKLQMRFESLDEARFSAVESLSFTPIARPCNGLTLDAVGLKINSVRLGAGGGNAGSSGSAVEHSQNDEKLMLRFDPPLEAGQRHELVIDYVCENPYDGMTFTPSSPAAPNYSPEVHTQGQTDTNRHWFVCHDFPNERMSTELIVDIPAGYAASSNGKLVSNLTSGDRSVWHWLQEKPHVAYLVSLVIGRFDIVEIPHPRVPMKVWAPPGTADLVMQTYGRTGEMIDLFERRFGVAYPWDRYDQLIVKNFGAGGMENTAATTMYPTAILDKAALLDGDLDGLISHELCHQWTGDMITCRSWEHIWLNEGWATYGSAMWSEQRFGAEGYLDSIRGNFGVARRDRTTNELPMVSNVYESPDETFRRAANPYPKGSAILHMLRMMLGDETFWKGVQLYMNRHAMGVVETNDFRYAMEEVSGLGLEWFFEQWCYRPGVPELKSKVQYDGVSRELVVTVEQTQKIDAQTPAFRFMLPVVTRTASGDRTFAIDVSEKSTTFRTVLDAPPSIVAIDPSLHVLKTLEEDKPLPMWIEQAQSGPTIVARHDAISALGGTDTPQTIALLTQIIGDEKIRYTLRNTAVAALAKYGSAEARHALLAMATQGVGEARVRSELVEQLRNFEKDKVLEALTRFANTDPSYEVRVQAIAALAHHKAGDRADAIVELAKFESQHDKVRSAALRALATLDDKRGLDLGMQYAAYGHVDRSRPTAIDTVAKLAKHDKDRAVEFLLELLSDPESRSRSAAGSALAEIGDARAIEPIRAIAQSSRDPSMRQRAERWLTQLQEQQGGERSTAAVSGRPARGERPGRGERSGADDGAVREATTSQPPPSADN